MAEFNVLSIGGGFHYSGFPNIRNCLFGFSLLCYLLFSQKLIVSVSYNVVCYMRDSTVCNVLGKCHFFSEIQIFGVEFAPDPSILSETYIPALQLPFLEVLVYLFRHEPKFLVPIFVSRVTRPTILISMLPSGISNVAKAFLSKLERKNRMGHSIKNDGWHIFM